MPKRERLSMPGFFRDAINARGLMSAYKDDYIGWIKGAKLESTRQKRLKQMLNELKKGGVYMKMKWTG